MGVLPIERDLESADKFGSNLIFWTESLVNDDIPDLENRLPRRAAVVRERFDGGRAARCSEKAGIPSAVSRTITDLATDRRVQTALAVVRRSGFATLGRIERSDP